MARRKLPYQLGDWFAVPLQDQGYGIGLVARSNGQGVILGYFFGPRCLSLPSIDDVCHFRDKDATVVWRFGDRGLTEGRWLIIGRLSDWRAADWPVPTFGRIDVLEKGAWRVDYVDATLVISTDEPTDIEEARKLPQDGLLGAVAVENALTHLLSLQS